MANKSGDEVVVQTTAPVGTVRSAAEAAAQVYEPENVEQHAKAIMAAWEAKLREQTKKLGKLAAARRRQERQPAGKGEGEEIAEPISLYGYYPWFDVLLAGPFQFAPPAYLPAKIVKAGDPTFFIAALWMNPFGINFDALNPSACTVMGAFNATIRFHTINLTTVAAGPALTPIVLNPIGPGCLKLFYVPLNFPPFVVPPQGDPNLYEINMTIDITGPVGGLPFAGYNTWVYDPDYEPPFLYPFSYLGGVPPQLVHDIPARFAVYNPFFSNTSVAAEGKETSLGKGKGTSSTNRAFVRIQLNQTFESFETTGREELIKSIAKITNTPAEEIRFIYAIPGSVLVTLELPEEAALTLMNLFFDRSPIIKELKIDKIEIRRPIPSSADSPQPPYEATHHKDPINYQRGLQSLRNIVESHPHNIQGEFYVLEARLLDLLRDEYLFGGDVREKKARVIDSLNSLIANSGIGDSFIEFCRVAAAPFPEQHR